MNSNTYFKDFHGPYTPMEGKLIDAIRALEHRVAMLEKVENGGYTIRVDRK
jgi:hypothetical protein